MRPPLPEVGDERQRRSASSPWRLAVAMRVDDLVRRFKKLDDRKGSSPEGHRVVQALNDAWVQATARDKSLRMWWSGYRVERAWQALHRAEAELLTLDPHLGRASIPRLKSRIAAALPDDEPRRTDYTAQLQKLYDATDADFADQVDDLAALYREVYAANDEQHQRLRKFRNLLVVATLALSCLLVVLAIWHAIAPEFLSLCGRAPDEGGNREVRRCVDGGSAPAARDLVLVLMLGTLGGVLSVAFTLGRQGAGRNARFDPTPIQMSLKAASGATTGLIGVLLLQSGLILVTVESSEAAVLTAAAVFGFAQHLLTRFVDLRANRLLGAEDDNDEQ
jgi:hypothetical protein